jgi:saxitoxin biosynthesis operon SxtJ-like protein
MTASLHEDYRRSETVKGSSDRGFGLTVGGILLLIVAVRIWRHSGYGAIELVLGAVGLCLIVLALVRAQSLSGLNRAWTRLGLLLFKVVNPVVLALIYLVTIVPIGLIMRACGHDPLRLKRDPSASTYWVKREPPGPAPETMINQF